MIATRLELRDRAKRRADMEDSRFVDDEEWNDYLNEALSSLHDILVMEYRDYYREKLEIPIVAGTEEYDLPNGTNYAGAKGFYKGLGVYWKDDQYLYELDPFMMGENTTSIWALSYAAGVAIGRTLMYRFIGSRLAFTPIPTETGTVQLWYIPQSDRMTEDDHGIDFPVVNGWEEYVILEAAMKALEKQESFEQAEALDRQLERMRDRIKVAAQQRDGARPQRIRDVRKSRWFGRRRRRY